MYDFLVNNPIGFMILALVRNIFYLLVAVIVMIGLFEVTFRWMNRSLGISFREHAWERMRDDPKAVALYFGLRILGVLVACGLVASAFIK